MNLATDLNQEILGAIAAESIGKLLDSKAPNARRWINAIARAVAEIEQNPYLTFDLNSHELLILSEHSGNIYRANGSCQCRAFEMRQPCFHRAMSRLVVIYLERVAAHT